MEKEALELLKKIKNDKEVDENWFIKIRDEIEKITDNNYMCSDKIKEEILSYAEYIYMMAGAIEKKRSTQK